MKCEISIVVSFLIVEKVGMEFEKNLFGADGWYNFRPFEVENKSFC